MAEIAELKKQNEQLAQALTRSAEKFDTGFILTADGIKALPAGWQEKLYPVRGTRNPVPYEVKLLNTDQDGDCD